MERKAEFAGRMRAVALEVTHIQSGSWRTSSDPARREAALALRCVVESVTRGGLWAEHRLDCIGGRKRIASRLIVRITIILRSYGLTVTVKGTPTDTYVYFKMEW